MPTHRSHLLSIALTPTAARLAEAKRAGGKLQVLRESTLVFAEGAGLDEPTALGAALAEHLKAEGYGTRNAVIGLCPRWVLTRHKHLPPADTDAMRGIVNLQIEREFAGTAADMSFDYLQGDATPGVNQAPLLLAGVRSSVLSQVNQAASAAGLKVEAVTPTTLAAAPGRAGTVVLVEQGVAGVMRVQDEQVVGLASCPVDADKLSDDATRARFLADLARCMIQLPSVDGDDALALLLPEAVPQADAQQLTDAAAERFGSARAEQADPAALLADHAMQPDQPLINFDASRLAPPPRRRVSPAGRWAIRAAVVALLIFGTAGYLWMDATSRRDALQAEYDAIKDKADELATVRGDIRKAQAWYDKRPPALDCLLELTRTFPTRGEIRVETLALNGDMTGRIECTAEDRETMDDYFAQMRESKALLDVNRGTMRPRGGRSDWINFPIAFRFNPGSKGGQE